VCAEAFTPLPIAGSGLNSCLEILAVYRFFFWGKEKVAEESRHQWFTRRKQGKKTWNHYLQCMMSCLVWLD